MTKPSTNKPKRRYNRKQEKAPIQETMINNSDNQKLEKVSTSVLKIYIGKVRLNFDTCDNVEYL